LYPDRLDYRRLSIRRHGASIDFAATVIKCNHSAMLVNCPHCGFSEPRTQRGIASGVSGFGCGASANPPHTPLAKPRCVRGSESQTRFKIMTEPTTASITPNRSEPRLTAARAAREHRVWERVATA